MRILSAVIIAAPTSGIRPYNTEYLNIQAGISELLQSGLVRTESILEHLRQTPRYLELYHRAASDANQSRESFYDLCTAHELVSRTGYKCTRSRDCSETLGFYLSRSLECPRDGTHVFNHFIRALEELDRDGRLILNESYLEFKWLLSLEDPDDLIGRDRQCVEDTIEVLQRPDNIGRIGVSKTKIFFSRLHVATPSLKPCLSNMTSRVPFLLQYPT